MHPAAWLFVKNVVQSLPPLKRVVEFGSLAVNGTVREILTDATGPGGTYLGIDLRPGANVGLVADACDWDGKGAWDAVVCCEVAEHCPRAADLFASARRALKPGGVFVFTCAGPGRAVHSWDGGDLKPGEFYGWLDPRDVEVQGGRAGFDAVLTHAGWRDGRLEDTYALGLVRR